MLDLILSLYSMCSGMILFTFFLLPFLLLVGIALWYVIRDLIHFFRWGPFA